MNRTTLFHVIPEVFEHTTKYVRCELLLDTDPSPFPSGSRKPYVNKRFLQRTNCQKENHMYSILRKINAHFFQIHQFEA